MEFHSIQWHFEVPNFNDIISSIEKCIIINH